MALLQAIIGFTHLPRGFRNCDVRPQVEALWGRPYSAAQMTYDLRRLRLKGLIHRVPKTHRYTATSYGLKVAFFYAKLYLRILRPSCAALLPEDERFPSSLRAALDVLDREIQKLHEEAALAAQKTCFSRIDHLPWRCLATDSYVRDARGLQLWQRLQANSGCALLSMSPSCLLRTTSARCP
jgi:hypothetical protein